MPQQLQVTYTYGFPAEIGGGPYDRTRSLLTLDTTQFDFVAVVGSGPTPTLETAIANWNVLAEGSQGIIILPGFETLDVNLTGAAAIALPAQSQLWILAAQPPTAGETVFIYDDALTVLRGSLEVQAPPLVVGANVPPAGQLTISGVWISGSLHIVGGAANVQLMDCTLVPGIALGNPRPGRGFEVRRPARRRPSGRFFEHHHALGIQDVGVVRLHFASFLDERNRLFRPVHVVGQHVHRRVFKVTASLGGRPQKSR